MNTHYKKLIVVGSTFGRVAIKWLILGQVTLFVHVNHLGIITNARVNPIFQLSGVCKSSTGLSGWG